eukprot:2991829-Pleurochrysis_carterae.AAC.1
MPSGLFIGPENSSSTVRDERAREVYSGVGCSGSSEAFSPTVGCTEGSPEGWSSSSSGNCATASGSTCWSAGLQG